MGFEQLALIVHRTLALGPVMISVCCRTPGLYQRFPSILFNSVFCSFSDCHASELSGSSFGRSSCEKADRGAYRKILVNDDQHNLEYTFQLLMDIVGRPCLGHFVKRIEYAYMPSDGDDYPELPYQRNLSADDMYLLRRAVQNAGFRGNKEEKIINMLMQTKLDHDLGYNTPDGCGVW